MAQSKTPGPVPLLPIDLQEPAELLAAIRQRRGGELINLDRMLLHSIPFARGWNAFLGAVRRELSVSPVLREIAICGVAILNKADYEFLHHAPELAAAGATPEQIEALRSIGESTMRMALFSPVERDAIALTLHLTRDVSAPPELMQRLRDAIGNTALVELVGTIAAYNMVSRFLIALGVNPEDRWG